MTKFRLTMCALLALVLFAGTGVAADLTDSLKAGKADLKSVGVLAFGPDGKPMWQSKVTSEVVSPPKVAEGTVVVWSGDGRIFGVSAADGKTRWVY